MSIARMLAQMTVRDYAAGVAWYTSLFGREPDARPMDGLAEWHLADTFGVQVWAEAARAGHSSLVLDETDLDARAVTLEQAGIPHEGPTHATSVRILPVTDPDGNRIVFTGPLTA